MQCFLAKIEKRQIYILISQGHCRGMRIGKLPPPPPPPPHHHHHHDHHPPSTRDVDNASARIKFEQFLQNTRTAPCSVLCVGYSGHKHCDGDVDQLVESRTVTLLTQVRFPGAPRDFLPDSTFSADSLTMLSLIHI